MGDGTCTLWLDGWPWGSGREWLRCCLEHDAGATDLELFHCVAQVSWPMGVIMLVGLSTVGIIYRRLKRK